MLVQIGQASCHIRLTLSLRSLNVGPLGGWGCLHSHCPQGVRIEHGQFAGGFGIAEEGFGESHAMKVLTFVVGDARYSTEVVHQLSHFGIADQERNNLRVPSRYLHYRAGGKKL